MDSYIKKIEGLNFSREFYIHGNYNGISGKSNS